jgi:hypothetical protein
VRQSEEDEEEEEEEEEAEKAKAPARQVRRTNGARLNGARMLPNGLK